MEKNTTRSNTLTDIKKEVKNSDKIILATDPDREGEAISWHLLSYLIPKIKKNLRELFLMLLRKKQF